LNSGVAADDDRRSGEAGCSGADGGAEEEPSVVVSMGSYSVVLLSYL
jgi:hypothetical protein